MKLYEPLKPFNASLESYSMKSMTTAEVRRTFLDFFSEMKHQEVDSSSLVPANDPTLLFANSGMVQFKDTFLGNEKRDYKRATTSQKCMRVSGKHNDLEEVGPSNSHHTFFEMLGNFSFGDYFKLEAMQFAWELLTKAYGLPADRLAVTIYEKDDESYDLWVNKIGVPTNRIARLGPDDNFWQMAETGPCGPNTEIHWDRTPELGEDGIVQSLLDDDGRFLEIWNLVFMQFNRTQPDPEHTGQYDEPLPAPGVDTGMGLERMASVLQGVEANYETDAFMPIIQRTQDLAGTTDEEREANIVPYRVIADHMRAAVFLISDGVVPGAKGRASVCRLVIRRAARFGTKLGFHEPFLADVADTVIDVMGEHYTELLEQRDSIKRTITIEEERFHRTMERGLSELEAMLDELPKGGQLSGEQAFYLKATLGLPEQVTKDIVEERGYTLDESGFEEAQAEHSLVSGAGQAIGEMTSAELYTELLQKLQSDGKLDDNGVEYNPYDNQPINAQILGLIKDGELADHAIVGEKVEVVLDKTNFYVESGGQVSDTGTLQGDGWLIEVEDMRKPITGLMIHLGEVVEGNPKVGDSVITQVDTQRRGDIIRNHTGTHLLHAALRNRLGKHVQQRGSLVAPDRLRFDFAHDQKVSDDELRDIEAAINEAILQNYAVTAENKSLDDARREGAMALFGEKYADEVRTISIASNGNRYSYELCGGVHVGETAEIGTFIFTSEGSVSAGIRRVEALTGRAATQFIQESLDRLHALAGQLGTTPEHAQERLSTLQEELNASRKQLNELQRKLAKFNFDEMLTNTEQINGKQALIAQLDGVPMDTMREMADWFRNKVDRGVLVLVSDINQKPQIIVSVTDPLIQEGVKAGNLIKPIAQVVGGGGGGRPQMAQAGGSDSSKIPSALDKARELIAEV